MTSVRRACGRGLVVVAAIVAVASAVYGDMPISLTDGVPVTGLSGSATSERNFQIRVPTGQSELQISISGGTGDCDLYVKRGATPTYNWYDYRPLLPGNDETVIVSDPAATVWYIMLRGHSDYSGVTLLATCVPAVPQELTNGVSETGISGRDCSQKVYYIDVPAGQSNLVVNTWGGTGDVDLYVKRGAIPGANDFDSWSYGPGTHETVHLDDPIAGRWYIIVAAACSCDHVTLRAVYGDGGSAVSTLENGVPVRGLSGALNSQTYFVLDVPAGLEGIKFRLSGGTGNCDMYIKKDVLPTLSDSDYQLTNSDNAESISITSGPLAGPWYVLLVGTQAYSDVTLQADFIRPEKPADDVRRLTPGVAVTDLAGKAGAELFFSIEVPSTVATLQIKMSGGTGDADLYVRKGELPATSRYDYRPYLTGNNEQVILTKGLAGTWYLMIRGYQAFSGVTLLATFDGVSPDGVDALENGVAVAGLAGSIASEKFYKIEVPAGQTQLEITMWGGTGDADLYVRIGEKPTVHRWDYRPFVLGNNETVTIEDPKAGTYYILIRGYRSYQGVTLKAAYGPQWEQMKTLVNCTPLTGLAGDQDSEAFFKINIPAGQGSLQIRMSGGTGDADLYVKKGEKPTAKSWDYHPGLHGNEEAVEIESPAMGTWYIMIRGYQAYSGVSLEACYKAGAQHDDGDSGCGCQHDDVDDDNGCGCQPDEVDDDSDCGCGIIIFPAQ